MAIRTSMKRPLSCISRMSYRTHTYRLSQPTFSTCSKRAGILNLQGADRPIEDFDHNLPPPSPSDIVALSPSKQNSKSRLKARTNHPIYRPPPSVQAWCKDPLAVHTARQIGLLDPTGARTRLFATDNSEAAKVGDILHVRTKAGDPFSGVCLSIKKQGVDTAILLRNQLTRIGVEMWFKIYSPAVEGIEVVQRRQKRARRARLYYMRKPKHDVGSVQNVVNTYLREKAALRGTGGGNVRGRDANSEKRSKKKSRKNK